MQWLKYSLATENSLNIHTVFLEKLIILITTDPNISDY